MPIFTDYQETQFDMEISVSLFHRTMNNTEKQEMRRLLRTSLGDTPSKIEFEATIAKLAENYLSLTNEEIEILNKVSSRFI